MGRRGCNLVQPVDSSSPIMRAHLLVASIMAFTRAWRTADDWATIISCLYQLDDTPSKGLLTGKVICNALSNDMAVNGTIDVQTPGLNHTSIFWDHHSSRVRKTWKSKVICLYVSPQGEEPPKLPHGMKWWNSVQHADDGNSTQGCL